MPQGNDTRRIAGEASEAGQEQGVRDCRGIDAKRVYGHPAHCAGEASAAEIGAAYARVSAATSAGRLPGRAKGDGYEKEEMLYRGSDRDIGRGIMSVRLRGIRRRGIGTGDRAYRRAAGGTDTRKREDGYGEDFRE